MLDLNTTTTGIDVLDATPGVAPQCATALLSANHNRTAMAQLKRQLRHRTITLRQLLEQPPPVHPYAPGSWGPVEADGLVRGFGKWRGPWVQS